MTGQEHGGEKEEVIITHKAILESRTYKMKKEKSRIFRLLLFWKVEN
jgi:hypothetical protein